MIADQSALEEIRQAWRGVYLLNLKARGVVFAATESLWAFGAGDLAFNLPFIHACAVLNDALEQLSIEGHFRCKSIFLGELVKASKKALPWIDHAFVSEIVKRRNAVAHKGEILPRQDCLNNIEAIEKQLRAWKILLES